MSEPSRRIQPIVSSLLELTGVALVIGGVYLLSPVAALILGGFATFFIGMAIDPPKREKGPEQ
ncbi:membrane protein [Mycobacterium phage Yeet]|uniref:Membrane protein n=4 Tax=Omegavirus TaxID=1623292 RepID=A0A3S9UAP0_9CAUD|nr:hypothetical protein [Acinetobacter baumannii]YP_008410168.1 membrane protein [Mycobacterium phage Redno2]YP_008410400.1 membrane protein [Mycobacterium phage Wanda]YP_009018018.1 membrane protein [Mycobacterium phage Thibault]YP_009123963.1 membrane protein [Mycobacterium phage Minerva]YP_009590864.1 membrane protein [Mycobacterium phage Optimus]YP_009636178.1 membrane protein [Mycobacterium phage Baka]ATN88819.1 membrane protein [Mycobacterium phage DmpstrDiver]ATN89727.1 membrane prot